MGEGDEHSADERVRHGQPDVPDEPLTCFVEIPKGSRNKYDWDADLHAIKARSAAVLVGGPSNRLRVHPRTLGLIGDALDAMVCVSEPTFPGCLIEVKLIALFRMQDDKGQDDKVLCVPLEDLGWRRRAGPDARLRAAQPERR